MLKNRGKCIKSKRNKFDGPGHPGEGGIKKEV